MKNDTELTEAGRQYAAAYAAHYSTRDLRAALQLYLNITTSYPDAQESEYSRAQIHNICRTVVPKQQLLDAETELAIAQFAREC